MSGNKTSFAFKLAAKADKDSSKEKWKARDGVTAGGCTFTKLFDYNDFAWSDNPKTGC